MHHQIRQHGDNPQNSDYQFADSAPFHALCRLLDDDCPWSIGVTGSLAFSLVMGRPYLTAASDLDLTLRCWQPCAKKLFKQLFLRYGEKGIRGEAEAGFPAALDALQMLLKLKDSCSFALALPQTLLGLMAQVNDTNVLWRADLSGLSYVKTRARQALALGGVLTVQGWYDTLKMQEEFVQRNISPGGCTDLLAIALFLLKTMTPHPPLAASSFCRSRIDSKTVVMLAP